MNKVKKSNWRYIWALPILALIFSSITKILHVESMVQRMEATGIDISLLLLGSIELLCAIIFILPQTRKIGFYLMTAYIGGIIAVEWIVPASTPVTGIVLQILLWTGMYFEYPDFFNLPLERAKIL